LTDVKFPAEASRLAQKMFEEFSSGLYLQNHRMVN